LSKKQLYREILALFPCTCVLQPTLVHVYQTSSLLSSSLPIVASASLRLLYSLLYSEHIKHIQVLSFLPFPYFSCAPLLLVCDPWPIIFLHLFWVYNPHMRENMRFLNFWAWLTLLKMMISSSIRLLANDKISFFFVAVWNSIVYKYHMRENVVF
jgi:hypothetical protein